MTNSNAPQSKERSDRPGLALVWLEFKDHELEAKLAGQVFGGHHRLASLVSHLADFKAELERCGSLDQMPVGIEMSTTDQRFGEQVHRYAWIEWHDKMFDRLCLLVEAFYVRLYELSDRIRKLTSIQCRIDDKRLKADKLLGTIRNLASGSDPSVLKKLEGLAAFYKAVKEEVVLRNDLTHESYLSIEYYDPERGSYDVGDLLIDFSQREDWISLFVQIRQSMIAFANEYIDNVRHTRNEVQAMMEALELVPANPGEETGAEPK